MGGSSCELCDTSFWSSSPRELLYIDSIVRFMTSGGPSGRSEVLLGRPAALYLQPAGDGGGYAPLTMVVVGEPLNADMLNNCKEVGRFASSGHLTIRFLWAERLGSAISWGGRGSSVL